MSTFLEEQHWNFVMIITEAYAVVAAISRQWLWLSRRCDTWRMQMHQSVKLLISLSAQHLFILFIYNTVSPDDLLQGETSQIQQNTANYQSTSKS